jgi:hypothetical protein
VAPLKDNFFRRATPQQHARIRSHLQFAGRQRLTAACMVARLADMLALNLLGQEFFWHMQFSPSLAAAAVK